MWGPGDDSDDEVDEEDLIQEYGLLTEPMDTSSDDPSQMSISQQQAFEVRSASMCSRAGENRMDSARPDHCASQWYNEHARLRT